MAPWERQRRWLGLALAASAVVHLVVLALLPTGAPARRVHASRPPLEVDVRWIDATPAPRPAPSTDATPRPPSTAAPSTAAVANPARSPAPHALPPPASDSKPSPGRDDAEEPGQLLTVTPAPAPARPHDRPGAGLGRLTPSAGFVLGLESGHADDAPRGETTANTPADLPDPVAMREYRGDELRRSLDLQLRQDLARAENGAGRVSGYFRRLESGLSDTAAARPPRHTPLTAGTLAQEVAKVALTPTISHEAQQRMADSALGRSAATMAVPLPNVEDQRFRESALQLMAQSEAVRERLEEPRLTTVVAITFDPTGAIADAAVEETSHDPLFDDEVLQLSRKVVRQLPESDEKGLGVSFWRSRWRFTWGPPGVRVRLLEVWPVDGAHP